MQAHEFDEKVPALIYEYAGFTQGLKGAVTNARIAAADATGERARNAPQWPYDQVYMCLNGVFYMNYSLKYNTREPADMEEASEEYYEAEQLCAILAWEKVRSIYHVDRTDWDDSLLDVPVSRLADLPQWAMCLNIANQDMFWDEKKPYGIIFHRAFGIKTPENAAAAGVALEGEPGGAPNNLSSVIVLEDETFVQGPFVDLTFKGTVREFLEQFSQGIIERTRNEGGSAADQEKVIANVKSYDLMARRALSIYLHLIANLDKLTDKQGRPVKAPGNPQTVKTKKGVRLFSPDSVFTAWLKE